MLAVSVATSLISAKQKVTAGKIAEGEAKTAAKSEELAAIQREGDRKSRLASALATQTARAGAGGISAFEGSPLSVLQESIRVEETATERDTFQTRLGALTTRARGSIASSKAKAEATVGLIGSFGKAASLVKFAPSGGGGGGSPLKTAANPRGLAPGQGL
jgi:hypothetical protein